MSLDLLASMLPGVLTGAGSAIQSGLNYKAQQEQLEYEKAMQKEAWSREDNAVQRRVADLKAAGLSPVLAAGSAASSSSPIHVNAPQVQGNPMADAIAVMQGQKNIAQTQASTEAVKQQSEKSRTENWLLKREADVVQQRDKLEGDNTGRMGEAIMRQQVLEANRDTALAQSRAANFNAESAEWDAASRKWDYNKSVGRNVRTGAGQANELGDMLDMVKNGSGAQALLLQLLMSASGSAAGMLGKKVIGGR